MKSKVMQKNGILAIVCAMGGLLAGCATTGDNAPTASNSSAAAGSVPSKYRASDGRNVEIGKSYPSEGGLSFKDPHLDKCWVAQEFKFSGYYTHYIATTMFTAKFH